MGKRYSNIVYLFSVCVDGLRQENDTNADPQNENARDPKAHENAIVLIHEEPERDARGQAERRGEKKRSIDFIKHNLMRMRLVVFGSG